MIEDDKPQGDGPRPYRVLSLDGGGMRGIYTAAFLDRLVTHFALTRKKDALDLGGGFDLITGTSTGAIVACALAIGKPLSDVMALYEKHGAAIFPHRIKGTGSAIYRALRGRTFVRAGDRALRNALHDVLGDVTMLDVFERRGISLSIPSVLMKTHRAWVFKKTPKSGVRDDKYPLADVCLASSAAPIYRSLASIDDPMATHGLKQVFADGGLWANNPILVGLLDALMVAERDQPIEIFSLGTCSRPEGEHIDGAHAHRSILGWKLGADVAPLSISAQEFAYDNMARLLSNVLTDLGRPVRTLRFPKKDVPAEMMPFLALDDTRKGAIARLVQQACSDADITKSSCDDPRNPDGQMVRSLMMDLPTMPVDGLTWESTR
ncbi:patatin-like phospholipase family protein [Methylobacterium sp. WL12]|uniref:patatin-like phospholipase family protein n=1 Tax=Methylobacterium sp. WL12 TaxID=2603890 RepID=UPI0011C89A42|nr:patatin-like phospholipase family protein [Methylobacterium sp. WL12]TXM73771.1 patatin-like phospholipase family protein [Methylobacterium sp. WL12]